MVLHGQACFSAGIITCSISASDYAASAEAL